jgi:hypothetical protein
MFFQIGHKLPDPAIIPFRIPHGILGWHVCELTVQQTL